MNKSLNHVRCLCSFDADVWKYINFDFDRWIFLVFLRPLVANGAKFGWENWSMGKRWMEKNCCGPIKIWYEINVMAMKNCFCIDQCTLRLTKHSPSIWSTCSIFQQHAKWSGGDVKYGKTQITESNRPFYMHISEAHLFQSHFVMKTLNNEYFSQFDIFAHFFFSIFITYTKQSYWDSKKICSAH